MIEIFQKTLPFFALIGLGYFACRVRFFTEEAAAALTKFVFYFALSAMLFRFAANIPITQLFDLQFALAYLAGTMLVYLLVTGIALARNTGIEEAAIEAQCSVIGNTGFLGVPMFIALFGSVATGPVLLALTIDLVVFSSLLVIIINTSRAGTLSVAALKQVFAGLVRNPMIVSISLGLLVSSLDVSIPAPADDFLVILGAAATPGALFAIGTSLASKSAERLVLSGWLSFAKLVLHPASVAVFALLVFDVAPFPAAMMISVAALPVAGNVYILAQHYGVAPTRVSASILISTIFSIMTVTLVIALLAPQP